MTRSCFFACVFASLVFGCSRHPYESPAVKISRLIAQNRHNDALVLSTEAIKDPLLTSSAENVVLLALHLEVCEALDLGIECDAAVLRLSKIAPKHEILRKYDRPKKLPVPPPVVKSSPKTATRPSSVMSTRMVSNRLPYSYEQINLMPEEEPENLAPLVLQPPLPSSPRKHSNRPDFENRIQSKIAPEFDEREGWAKIPMDAPLRQVIRADLGLGMDVPYQVAPVVTTGRSAAVALSDDLFRPRRAALAGQAIADCQRPDRMRLTIDLPNSSGASPTQPTMQTEFECSDGRDNNFNGFVDKSDPVCWIVPGKPETYSPYATEAIKHSIPHTSVPSVSAPPISNTETPE